MSNNAMATPAGPMIELPNPFSCERGVIRVVEERALPERELLQQLLFDSYDRPYVFDNGFTRSLMFSSRFVQSSMRIRDPARLEFLYTQKMMSFLLFQGTTKNILMLGLGGGSLAKHCYAHLTGSDITVVEIDPYVIAFRDQFLIPADDARFRIVCTDASEYIENSPRSYDVILMDVFDRNGLPPSIDRHVFYHDVKGALSRAGIFVANLAGPKQEWVAHLQSIRDVFDDAVFILQVDDTGNHIVLAFRDPLFEPLWHVIENKANCLKQNLGIDFLGFTKKLQRGQKLGYLDRIGHAYA